MARMVAMGVFNSCVTADTKSDRSVTSRAFACAARDGQHQTRRRAPRHWRPRARASSARPDARRSVHRSSETVARATSSCRVRSAGLSSSTRPGSKKSKGIPRAERIVGPFRWLARHRPPVAIEIASRTPLAGPADSADLFGELLKVVRPDPIQIDHEPQNAFEPIVRLVRILQPHDHLISDVLQRTSKTLKRLPSKTSRPMRASRRSLVRRIFSEHHRKRVRSTGGRARRASARRGRKTRLTSASAAAGKEHLRIRVAREGAADGVQSSRGSRVASSKSSDARTDDCTPRMSLVSAVTSRSAAASALRCASSVALRCHSVIARYPSQPAPRPKPPGPRPATAAADRDAASAKPRRHRASSRSR